MTVSPSNEKRPSVAHSFKTDVSRKVLSDIDTKSNVTSEIETQQRSANYQSFLNQVDSFLAQSKKETKRKSNQLKRVSYSSKFPKQPASSRI